MNILHIGIPHSNCVFTNLMSFNWYISKRFECKSFRENIVGLVEKGAWILSNNENGIVIFSFGRAYRNTGGGEDCPEHFNVMIDPMWPVSTIIFGPDWIFGGTLFTGSLVNEVEKFKIPYHNRVKPKKRKHFSIRIWLNCLIMWDVSAPIC